MLLRGAYLPAIQRSCSWNSLTGKQDHMHLTSLKRHLSGTWDASTREDPMIAARRGKGAASVPMTAGRLFVCSLVFFLKEM